jgi:hypothetical protein
MGLRSGADRPATAAGPCAYAMGESGNLIQQCRRSPRPTVIRVEGGLEFPVIGVSESSRWFGHSFFAWLTGLDEGGVLAVVPTWAK